ncbi:unnamed protein product [Leptidea sinapis]|uniref:Uncharacterized protein n=1 Tax=Leptidea sinapis TaxID=189913 RepID=A0A5E4QKV8_9NEOP|nr:unnamed protein product [Leptidea sinapis]
MVNEDVELRRIFPSEFPQDTIRRSGVLYPEHLGRYKELKGYFFKPKSSVNSHFEELACYDDHDSDRYSLEENQYYMNEAQESHVDRRRVYCYIWELSDGSKHEEQGQLKNQGTENEATVVQGQYSWVGPDGVTYTVTYIADENGFQPQIQQGPGGAVPPALVLLCFVAVAYGAAVPPNVNYQNYYNPQDLVLLGFVTLALAAPQAQRASPSEPEVQILRLETENSGLGSYRYAWVGPDGVTYTVTYLADENGFQPTIEQGPGGAVPPGVVASLLG